MLGQFGRSRAKRVESEARRVNFDDVPGIDEAEEQLVEVVDFLRNPEPLPGLGASIPRGVLLRARRGPARRCSPGPSRARPACRSSRPRRRSSSRRSWASARHACATCSSRPRRRPRRSSSSTSSTQSAAPAAAAAASCGGHDEREQTLNQILTEMDGFDPRRRDRARRDQPPGGARPGAAAPRALRPPRRTVQPPDSAGREQILRVHTRAVPLADDVDLEQIAPARPAWSEPTWPTSSTRPPCWRPARPRQGAARGLHRRAGEDRARRRAQDRLSEDDRRRIAYHEGGHAIVGMLTPGADPVRKVSIIPRGQALGVTLSTPDDDRFNYSEDELGEDPGLAAAAGWPRSRLRRPTTGAESDIQQFTGSRAGWSSAGG